MVTQLFVGSVLMIVTMVLSAVIWLYLEYLLLRVRPWFLTPPHALKLLVLLCTFLGTTLLMMTVTVWIWALAYLWLDLFGTLEESVYFSLVSFTTLGFGDVLLDKDWRLLGGMAAANGLVMFGLMAAMLVEMLRQTRLSQQQFLRQKEQEAEGSG